MPDNSSILADHYQQSFEITLDIWEKRSRTLMILLLVVGGATLLTFDVPQAQPILVDLIAHLLSIEDSIRQAQLRSSFPYGLMQTILLMVILYLTLILYHRTAFIIRSYKYLAAVENDIREELKLGENQTAFTREGHFYNNNRPRLSTAVAYTYTGMLGVLLAAFLGGRIYSDICANSMWFVLVDITLAVPTIIFYGAYALEPYDIFSSRNKN